MPSSNAFPVQPAEPIVRVEAGLIRADSRDVATHFKKNHFDVLKALRNLQCSEEFRARNFASFKINDLTGESTSHVMMTKDGFMFLTLGFTGAEAAALKEAFIGRFNAMEAELRARPVIDPIAALNDPNTLRNLLGDYAGRLIEAQETIAAQAPKVAAFKQVADGEGTFCVTAAAKMLKVQPKALFAWLKAHEWIYRRAGGRSWLGYQAKVLPGYLTHIPHPVVGADGVERVYEQVRITAKGLARLGELLAAEMPAPAE